VTARIVHRRIATSQYHTCVIMGAEATGPVKCWGMYWNGQLGYGDTVSRGGSSSDMGGNLGFVDLGTGRTAKSLALGSGFSCALLDNDKVKCWGSRRFSFGGHWDDDSTTNRGDEPGEMGDNLEYVDLGTGNTVKAITAGGSHTCAILHDDTLKCCAQTGVLGLTGSWGTADLSTQSDMNQAKWAIICPPSNLVRAARQRRYRQDNITHALFSTMTRPSAGAIIIAGSLALASK